MDINNLFVEAGFIPNENQLKAITHVDGPLFLMAGPGSGKTRVLLWRTLNLIVFYGVQPDEIYLSTFTEKAALQLKEGLLSLLGITSKLTGESYDISHMYVGTVHSLCQRLITDRRLSEDRSRTRAPILLDDLGQYFFLASNQFWRDATAALELSEDIFETINLYFGKRSSSKHNAITNCISLFNRFSEEKISPDEAGDKAGDEILEMLARIYGYYIERLGDGGRQRVDFSLLQQSAYDSICQTEESAGVFKHVIVDEYQDTNAIQEKLFFRLAASHQNICIVGDDDQALYRFRGATVENFVQFPDRCVNHLKRKPTAIRLNTNYRSRKHIVDFYTRFIDQEDWIRDKTKKSFYRLVDKNIQAHSKDAHPSVVASSQLSGDDVAEEVAGFVKSLIGQKKVSDPNQIAFLFPSLKGKATERMKAALEAKGLLVYAPRAGRFLECDEPTEIFGLFLKVVGRPKRVNFPGTDYKDFHDWLDTCEKRADELMAGDLLLARYVADKRMELETATKDYGLLVHQVSASGWSLDLPYDPDIHKRSLGNTAGISDRARRSIGRSALDKIAKQRIDAGDPFRLNYIVNRATSPDWSILDLFYRLCGFDHFKAMFDKAERAEDEGPICNLGLISEYIGRFIDRYGSVITGSFLNESRFCNALVMGYLYALFRLGESEYEDADDPFPKGRIPFLTIHQSKGLEFPVVVLGSPDKRNRGPQKVEELVRPMLFGDGEPLDRIAGFDIMRMFYVALSRAKNLLVIANPRGQGLSTHYAIKALLDDRFPRIPRFDLSTLPESTEEKSDIAKSYSFTADYLMFQKCPRQYMIFRKYGFVPSRSQIMFFGTLVHQTIEDLHNRIIALRSQL
jgi:DNA helicase-2/ATP-dependent DNA helicase PcrA